MMLERFNSVFTSSIIPPFPTSIPPSETQFQFSEIARLIIQFAVVKNILFKGLSSILQKFPSLFIVKTNFFFKHWVILNCDSCCLITTLRAIRLHNSFHQEEQMVKFTHNNNINYRSSRPKMIWKMLLWIIGQNFHKNTRDKGLLNSSWGSISSAISSSRISIRIDLIFIIESCINSCLWHSSVLWS